MINEEGLVISSLQDQRCAKIICWKNSMRLLMVLIKKIDDNKLLNIGLMYNGS